MVGCSYLLCQREQGANGLSVAVLVSYIVSFFIFLGYTVFVVKKEVE